MKTIAALLLSSLTALAPVAATVKNPDTFVYATIADPESFDPAWAYDTASSNIIANVYEYLVAYQGSGVRTQDLVGRLATTVPSRANGLISADGLTYRFPIRKGVKFHDGTPLTPEDVRYSLIRFMLFDRDGGPSTLLLEPILGLGSTRKDGKRLDDAYDRAAKAVTVDGDSVVIRLPKPFAPFLTILATFGAVVSEKWCASHGQWDGRPEDWREYNNPTLDHALPKNSMNGTGPFKLSRLEANTKEVLLERNDAYWRGPAALKNVVIKVVDEFETRKLMIQAGDADSVYGPQMYYPQLDGLPGVTLTDGLHLLERSPIVFFSVKINPVGNPNVGSGKFDGAGIPPNFFADKDVRKGFAFAIDADAYVRDLARGKGQANNNILPPGILGHEDRPPKYRLDLKKSAEYLRKAWGGMVWERGFKLAVSYNSGSSATQSICQMIKKNIESLNPKFHVDVRVLQWSTYLEQSQQHKLPIFTAAWQADYPDPHNFAFPLLHSSGFYPTQQGYSNPELDTLIEQAVRTLDEDKRAALYRRIQDVYEEDLPNVQIADGARYRAARTWVKGYVFNPVFPDAPYGDYYYNLHKADELGNAAQTR